MKLTLAGILLLKPFDETVDDSRAGGIYAKYRILTFGVAASALLAIASLALTLGGHHQSPLVLGLAVCTSAITAGFEWLAGLQARALNQLFATVVVSAGITAFGGFS